MIPTAANTAIPEISRFLLDMRFAPEIVNLILFSAGRTLAAINRNKRTRAPTGGACTRFARPASRRVNFASTRV